MKKIELSDDFFSGMDLKKNSKDAGPARRETQAVRTILGTGPGQKNGKRPHNPGNSRPVGPGIVLSLPFVLAGHMMNLCASLIRATLSPFDRGRTKG